MREVVIFDTEFTAWQGSTQRNWTAPGEFREIIQIGAIILDAGTFEERDSFMAYVKPVFNPILSDYIVQLTGISQATLVARGAALAPAVRAFLSFCGGRPTYCYGMDGWIIAKNLALLGQAEVWPSLRPANIAPWFPSAGLPSKGLNSGSLARLAGASFDGQEHDALGDCRSIAAAIRVLVSRGAANPFAPPHPPDGGPE